MGVGAVAAESCPLGELGHNKQGKGGETKEGRKEGSTREREREGGQTDRATMKRVRWKQRFARSGRDAYEPLFFRCSWW